MAPVNDKYYYIVYYMIRSSILMEHLKVAAGFINQWFTDMETKTTSEAMRHDSWETKRKILLHKFDLIFALFTNSEILDNCTYFVCSFN